VVVDEVGCMPLERQAANLLFALVSRRYERGSIVVTSNRSFEQWGEILGDAMVAAALIDRLIRHATMVTLKGKSYRLRSGALGSRPSPRLRRYAAPPERQNRLSSVVHLSAPDTDAAFDALDTALAAHLLRLLAVGHPCLRSTGLRPTRMPVRRQCKGPRETAMKTRMNKSSVTVTKKLRRA
jgi:hypothetical protein